MKHEPTTLHIRLKVIDDPSPEERTILIPSEEMSVIVGNETTAPCLVCGKCGSILVKDFPPERIRNIVIQCFKCQSYNEID